MSKDYLWDHYSVFSDDSKVKICDDTSGYTKTDKVKCDIADAVSFFYREDELISDSAKDVPLELVRIDGKKYLTDGGATFSVASEAGISRAEFVRLLKSVHSDYELSLQGNDLCCEVKYPAMLLDCFRNMKNTIARLGCMH